MDELLSLMEEDFEEVEKESDFYRTDSDSQSSSNPLKNNENSAASSSSSSLGDVRKEKKDLTFKDIFGSPDKRDVKELGLSTITGRNEERRSGSTSSRVTTSPLSSRQLQLHAAIRRDNNVPFKPDNPPIVLDPYSRIRLLKNSISIYFDETVSPETVLKDRNIGLEYVSLTSFPSWYRGKGKDTKNFWISACLIRKTPGVRKSAKGNDYGIWELSDLKDFDRKVSVFLFGSSSNASNLLATSPGALVDITTPSVMPDTSGGGGAIKLSISNANQVRFIGTAKDFGFCQAKKKDGNKCTVAVNTWECSYCIHHASGELKKLNIGNGKRGKGNTKKAFFPNQSFNGYGGSESQESLKQQGIVITDFGGPSTSLNRSSSFTRSFNDRNSVPKAKPVPVMPPSSRMELQGPNNEMKKNSIKFGNPDSVKFAKTEKDHVLLKNEKAVLPARKPLDLDPGKTRHLSDKDRDLLRMLDAEALQKSSACSKKDTESKSNATASGSRVVVSDFITSSIVNNPSAASRNFMQYLTLQHAPKDQVDVTSNNKSVSVQPLVLSREKVKSMAKALDFVKKNGPIKKADPNAVAGRKRKMQQLSHCGNGSSSHTSSSSLTAQAGPSTKKRMGHNNTRIDVEFDFESEDFKKILNAKSAHDDELDEIQHEEYFSKLEKKEALENKLLTTFSIETNAVMCRQCKYVALSQSEFCKEQMHEVRLVKARKRFFKCKDCGNRTMSLDRLPKRPCSNCNNSNWLVAPVGKERKGPTLPSEMLAIRGNEEKFIGSAGSKMFLHLEM